MSIMSGDILRGKGLKLGNWEGYYLLPGYIGFEERSFIFIFVSYFPCRIGTIQIDCYYYIIIWAWAWTWTLWTLSPISTL